MDIAIESFIANLHPELADVTCQAFELMEAFESPFEQLAFIETLTDDINSDSHQRHDGFFSELYTRLSSILKAHKLTLQPDVPLAVVVDILQAFLDVQTTTEYDTIIALLDNTSDANEALAGLVHHFTNTDIGAVMEAVDSFDAATLTLLKQYLQTQSDLLEEPRDNTLAVKLLKLMKAILSKPFILGHSLLEAGINTQLNHQQLYPLVKEYLSSSSSDCEQFATDIASIAFLVKPHDPITPQDLYKEWANLHLSDLATITKGEIALHNLLNQLFSNEAFRYE